MSETHYRELTVKCITCGVIDEFRTDDLNKEIGDNWVQQCSEYPECRGDIAIITNISYEE